MADPVVIVEKIIEIAITITDAVDTVRENKEECRGIQKLVCRVSDLLSLLKESEMMRHREVDGPLKDLNDAISRAHDVVTACQGRNILCLFCKAGKLAKKLSQVKSDISQGMMLAIFATQAASVFVATKGQQSVVEDFSPRPLHEPPHSPDAVVGNYLLSCLPTQEHPPLEQEPRLHVHLSPPPPPPPPRPRTTLASVSKHLSHRPPQQPTPRSPPPPMPTFISSPPTPPSPPPSLPLPPYVTSPMSKNQLYNSPPPPSQPPIANIDPPPSKRLPPPPTTGPPPPPPPPPPPLPYYPVASIGPRKPGNLPHPTAHVPPRSPSQGIVEVSAPVSGSASNTSADDTSRTDERKNKLAETEGPPPPLPGLAKFSLIELKDATHNFSEKNKIGSSDFGTVYKGVLHGTLMVAIKKFQDPPQFLVGRLSVKLRIASKLQSKDMEASGHNNKYTIKVLGYGHECIWGHDSLETHIFLVEEYLPNGNMENIIYGYRLHWSSRIRIIQGLVQGLQYLHDQNIVHMNVKPANVLLDSDMSPKITNFGIGRVLEKSIIHDSNIAGTVGYMPPEYILEGTLSTKYDVYSFGVTLLETISSMCKAEPARHHASVTWAWNVHEYEQMEDLFDPSLFEKSQLPEIKRCLKIGLLCTQFEWAERPTMEEVLDMLNGEKGLTTPKQPEYTKDRGITSKGASRSGSKAHK